MTLEQLRIFVAVAERGHVTRAARDLNLTQSAVSASISALEDRHRVRLFHRVGRGVELSPDGAAFLGEARAVLAQAGRAGQALDDLAGLRRGAVRIAASQTVASYWLPQRMAAFADAHPGVSLALTVGNTAQVAAWVAGGVCDLGVVEGEAGGEAFEVLTLEGDALSLYAAQGHPLAARASVKADDLAGHAWILRETGSGTRATLEATLAARGVDVGALRVLVELPSNEAVLAAVESGLALTGLSDLAAAPHVAAGRLRRLAFDLVRRPFRLLTHRERPPGRAARAFADLASTPTGSATA